MAAKGQPPIAGNVIADLLARYMPDMPRGVEKPAYFDSAFEAGPDTPMQKKMRTLMKAEIERRKRKRRTLAGGG